MFLFKGIAFIVLGVFGFFRGIVRLVDLIIQSIVKSRKRYKLLVKIKNIIIKVLNLGASGYGLFTTVQPLIERFTGGDEEEEEAVS